MNKNLDHSKRAEKHTAKKWVASGLSLKKNITHSAQSLAKKLNKEIEKGHDTTAFMIALILAAFKDFLDIILDFFLIGLFPGVSFVIGLFLTSFIFFFLLHKGWLLKMRVRIWFFVLGLFIDGLPLFNALPINSIVVLYAWHLTKKRASKANRKLHNLSNLTVFEINQLNHDISLLEKRADK